MNERRLGVDAGRTEVYAAEVAAFEGTDLETVRPVEEIVGVIETLVTGDWWPGPGVVARPARRDARSSSARSRLCGARWSDHVEIRIARPQATVATAAHELAHALAGVDHGHDDLFRRAHLDVVAAITNLPGGMRRGDRHVDQLCSAYVSAGLPVGRRVWPEPPPTGTAIAL